MDRISEHISYNEAVKSYTADRHGIDNTPCSCDLNSMEKVAREVFEPMRVYFDVPIGIASFYRSEKLNKLIGGSKNSQHCFDDKTEILTSNGWKSKDNFDIENDKLFTYNIEEDNIEQLYGDELVVFNYEGDVIVGNSKHIDYVVDPEHRMYVNNARQNNKFNFERAEKGLNKRRVHKVASNKKNSDILLPDVNKARLAAAVIAEASVYTKRGTKHPFIRFNIKKSREIKELESLLAVNSIKYNKRYCKNREKQEQYGVYEYTIEAGQAKEIVEMVNGRDKRIPLWFLSYNSENLKEIIDTYSRFDGTIDNRNNNTGVSIFSKNEYTIDMLQAMSILSNRRAIKKELLDVETNFGIVDKFYHLYISNHNSARLNEECTARKEYKGTLWTVNNRNTTLIARRNGKVFITGNCLGEAIDIDADIYEGITNKEIFDYIYNNLEYDQLISEFPDSNDDPEWVHVSYDYEGNNRQETLVSYKDKRNKTKYRYYEEA